MLDVILNESQIVNKFKKDYIIPNGIKITDVIYLLVKKYHLDNFSKDDTYENIMNDLKKALGEDYIYTKWNNTVRGIVNKFYRTKNIYNIDVKMNDIKEIGITNKELNMISKLDDRKLEKIAFIMLVYAKISKIQMQQEGNEYWVNKSCSTICKEAKVGLKGNKQKKIMNELYKKQYISMSNFNTKVNMKINYADSDNTDFRLIINDFDNVVYQYLLWKGEKWKQCENENCGKWVKIKSNKTKYCKVCAREKEKEKYRKYNKKRK